PLERTGGEGDRQGDRSHRPLGEAERQQVTRAARARGAEGRGRGRGHLVWGAGPGGGAGQGEGQIRLRAAGGLPEEREIQRLRQSTDPAGLPRSRRGQGKGTRPEVPVGQGAGVTVHGGAGRLPHRGQGEGAATAGGFAREAPGGRLDGRRGGRP